MSNVPAIDDEDEKPKILAKGDPESNFAHTNFNNIEENKSSDSSPEQDSATTHM